MRLVDKPYFDVEFIKKSRVSLPRNESFTGTNAGVVLIYHPMGQLALQSGHDHLWLTGCLLDTNRVCERRMLIILENTDNVASVSVDVLERLLFTFIHKRPLRSNGSARLRRAQKRREESQKEK